MAYRISWVAILLWLWAVPAYGTSACGLEDADRELWWDSSDVILIARFTFGRVLRTHPLSHRSRLDPEELARSREWQLPWVSYDFEAHEIFKGDPQQIAEIIDVDSLNSLKPVIGKVYLLFLGVAPTNSVASIIGCTGSKEISRFDEDQEALIQWLREKSAVK